MEKIRAICAHATTTSTPSPRVPPEPGLHRAEDASAMAQGRPDGYAEDQSRSGAPCEQAGQGHHIKRSMPAWLDSAWRMPPEAAELRCWLRAAIATSRAVRAGRRWGMALISGGEHRNSPLRLQGPGAPRELLTPSSTTPNRVGGTAARINATIRGLASAGDPARWLRYNHHPDYGWHRLAWRPRVLPLVSDAENG